GGLREVREAGAPGRPAAGQLAGERAQARELPLQLRDPPRGRRAARHRAHPARVLESGHHPDDSHSRLAERDHARYRPRPRPGPTLTGRPGPSPRSRAIWASATRSGYPTGGTRPRFSSRPSRPGATGPTASWWWSPRSPRPRPATARPP